MGEVYYGKIRGIPTYYNPRYPPDTARYEYGCIIVATRSNADYLRDNPRIVTQLVTGVKV
jgi:hypothetical protein